MAIHYDKISIRIHDVLDSFSQIATRHVANSICLVEFWNSKSDTLVVILENREICFIHISATDETAHAAGAEDVTNEDGLAITPRFIPHPDRRATLNFFSVSQSGGVMWIAERNFCYNGTLLVTCVSERDIKQLEIKSDLPIRPKFLLLSIPARTLMAIYKNEGQEAFETRICQDLDFSASAINTKTIKIKGRVVSWSTDGRHVLIWQVDTNTQHRIVHCVYGDFKGLTTNTPAASLSQKTLGFGIMHLKVEFLNRTKSPFGTPYSFVDKPLVAVIIARSAGLGLLVWDISSDEIKKEMILSSDQGSDESVTDIEYSLSSNMKWIATCNRRSGAVRVFSIVTSALIWSYELEMKLPNYILSSSLYFDPLDSRLVIANREASFAFSLPCLLEKDQINLEVIMYDFQAKVEFPPKCLMPNPDLLSHNTLFNILSYYIPSTSRMTLLDFSILPYTSKATAVVRIMEEVSVVFGRVDVVFATLVNGFTRQAPENETRSQRPDKVTINQQSKKYAFCNNFTYVFLYQQENDQQYIALFSLRDGIRAVFVDICEGYSQEFIDFDNEVDTWFGISQTRNGIQVTCLGIYGVKIVDFGQRSVVCNVPYECHMIKWLKTFYSCFKCYDRKYIEEVLNQPVLDHLYFKFAELFRSYGLCDISDDGKRILLGWDVDKRREFILSQCSKDDEMSQLQSRAKYLVPCWTLNDNLQHRAYLEIDENKGNLSSLLFCGHGDVVVERLDQTKLNPNQKRSLNEISLTSGCTANLHFDASNGCLWFIVSIATESRKAKALDDTFYSTCIKRLHSNIAHDRYEARELGIHRLEKVWYFAQAFDQTGAFVLLIASVVKDCTVFLTLAVVFLLGFGLFMFVVFQYSLSVLECTENSNEECDDEIRNKIFSSFGNPLKAMLTLFYAMIGTFDPEVYFHSGVVAPFVILMFVAFVSIQMVIMFNMVIAIMNDTYDRVKTNEEQLLLLGKARNTSGKYLYVLFPKDDEEIVEDATWRGRIKTMEDKNKSMMNKTKREILNEINSIKKKQDSQYKEIMGRLVQLQKGVKDALELLLQNCQLTSRTRLEEHKGVKEDFTSLNSQVESKNVLPSCSKMTYLDQHVLTENESSADPSFVQELVDNVIFIKDSTTLKVDPVQLMEIPEAIKKDMIKRGTDLDRMFENKETLLGASSTHNAIELTQKLISHGVDIDCKDNDGWSPLHFAAMRNSLDLAKELIDCGAYINSRNSNGATPLHIAVENDSINIAKELISNDAEIDCETNMGYTPFYIAARRDSIDVARELLSSGANKESKGSDGLTPLLIAAKYNSFNVAKELIKSGANIEKQASDGWTALHIATESHSIDIVKELLHNGANVDSKTQARLTPLHCAAIFNAVEIAQELLLYKADVESLTETIETPLHVAAFWNSLSMVKILCENGANIEARTVTNETPLHIAAAKNSIDVAKELIKLGANVNSQTVQGKTPFCIASFNGSSEMMEVSSDLNIQIDFSRF
eukprot:g7278.t1